MSRILRIVRGPSSWLRHHPLLRPSEGSLHLPPSPFPQRPWAGLRDLLGLLLMERGEREVEIALRAHRLPLSLTLRGLLPSLTPEERAERERLRAQVPGYLSHHPRMSWRLREAWLEILSPLLEGAELRIPEVTALDAESLAILRGVLTRAERFGLHLGHDPKDLPAEPLWRYDARAAHAQVESLAALELAELIELEEPAGEPAAPRGALPLHPWDDDLERSAFESLRSEAPDPHRIAEAVEASFEGYCFTSALRLGLGLLESPERERLQGEELRRTHLLVALSAYNRQVQTRGESAEADEELAALLDHHLRASLEGEEDPALRAHGLYRLAINEGRRRGALSDALSLSDEAVAEARRAKDPFHEAWARNGRAYVRGRLRDLKGAIEDAEAAFALTEAPIAPPLEVERPLTHAVLADNLSTLYAFAKDEEKTAAWRERWAALGERLGGTDIPSSKWLEHLRSRHRLEEASALCVRGIEQAERMLVPQLSDYYAAELAELRYRRGEAAESYEALRRALRIRRRLENEEVLFATLLGAALAAWRAGRLEEATGHLRELLAHPLGGAAAAATELYALLGRVRATAGDPEAADEAINAAIEIAVASEERDLLLRVACAAGQACLDLGREEEAAAAFAQALEIGEQGERPPEAADQLEALVGALRTQGPTEGRVEEALSLLEEALRDAESWWLLEALQEAYQEAPAGDPSLLRRALAQRAR